MIVCRRIFFALHVGLLRATKPEPCVTPPCLFASLGTRVGRRLASWCPAVTSLGLARHDESKRAHAMKQHEPTTLAERLSAAAAANGPGLIFDVGSFDGGDAISFAQSGGHSVVTFEPSPSKLGPIRARLAAAGVTDRVRLHPYALSNVSGEVRFLVFNADPSAGAVFRKFAEETSKGHGRGGGRGGSSASIATGSAQDMVVADDATSNECTPSPQHLGP